MREYKPELQLVNYENPILRTEAETVKEFDRDLQGLVLAMLECMHLNKGMGLAAPQVGIGKRIIVTSFYPEVLINPVVLKTSEDLQKNTEGCLSFPGWWIPVERPYSIQVAFNDEKGSGSEMVFHGIQAQCIQHEIDHLNGLLFTRFEK